MNFNRLFFLTVFLMATQTGCLFFNVKDQAAKVALAEVPTGKIVNRKAILKEGSLAVLPFKAGEGVWADPQLDRMSMMISKGVIDYLNEQKLPVKILTTQDQGAPDMLIEGYIESYKRPGKMSRWFLRKKISVLKISGQMMLVDNKERLVVFQQSKSMPESKRDGLELAYQLGQDIGKFLTDVLKSE